MKRPVTVSISHSLGRDGARGRLVGGLDRVRDRIAGFGLSLVEERWEADTLHFGVAALGQTVSGRIEVEEDLVRVEVALPWLLASFADKLRDRVEAQGRILLEHLPKKS
ncbi:polyhydroxyalkanoic acid system family protein [Bosea sp. TWI1241]|jgi:hypothetical protein|uniref:polyhydroxyalkanoic acid system family protein n=1 Tax=Bosea sp. TWI1241 TaxID=3148904 RepID=UPI0032095282